MSDILTIIGVESDVETCPAPLVAGGPGIIGYRGTRGETGSDGTNGFTITAENFVTGSASVIEVSDPSMFVVGSYIFVEGAGTYQITKIEGATIIAASQGDGLPDNSVIPVGRIVSAGSKKGVNNNIDEVRPYALLASRTASGVNVAGSLSWRRPLTELIDTHNKVALAANNMFSLESGNWLIRATSSSFKQGAHHTILRKQPSPYSDQLTSPIGTQEWNHPILPEASTRSDIFAYISETTVMYFALDHYSEQGGGANGFGVASAFGVPETYAYVEVRAA